jgi:hypothetical protein
MSQNFTHFSIVYSQTINTNITFSIFYSLVTYVLGNKSQAMPLFARHKKLKTSGGGEDTKDKREDIRYMKQRPDVIFSFVYIQFCIREPPGNEPYQRHRHGTFRAFSRRSKPCREEEPSALRPGQNWLLPYRDRVG